MKLKTYATQQGLLEIYRQCLLHQDKVKSAIRYPRFQALASGKCRPTKDLALVIEHVTGGDVTPHDFPKTEKVV